MLLGQFFSQPSLVTIFIPVTVSDLFLHVLGRLSNNGPVATNTIKITSHAIMNRFDYIMKPVL